MATLQLKNINKIYPNKVQAVFDFNLDIKDKEFIVFVGPSGCGKSTTLRMVAGLEDITSGELYIDDRLVNFVEPKDRDIAMVFQNYALYPHMSVYGNMAFALKLRKVLMPIFEENDEIKSLREENKEILKTIKDLYKGTTKKNGNKNPYDEIAALYNKIFDNESKIESIQVQKVGVYEHRIKELEKTVKKLKKDIPIYQKFVDTEKNENNRKIFLTGLEQAKKQLEKSQKELEHLKNNEVPLFENRKLNSYEINLEIQKAAQILDLTQYLYRKPSALSGGQRQRVALGRAIVRHPKVFLMDEPLSNLDAKLRVQTRSEIIKIHKRVGATTIYVTHDQTEAMTMADRIVVMKGGYIQQIGTPEDIYENPDNIFVAGFIGNPPMNFVDAQFDGKQLFISNEKEKVEIKLLSSQLKMLKDYKGGVYNVVVGIRPENVKLMDDSKDNKNQQALEALCEFKELLGQEIVLYTTLLNQKFLIKVDNKTKVKVDSKLKVVLDNESMYFFDKENSKRIR